MFHPIYKILSFKKLEPFVLQIRFDDKTERVVDFHPILSGKLYGPLKNQKVFNRVRLDSEVHTLIWPNGADFDPAILHDWPKYRRPFIAASRRWRSKRRSAD